MRVAIVLLLVSCAHSNKSAKNEQAAPSSRASASTLHGCSSDLDCGQKQLCVNAKCVDITNDANECGLQRVHFAFNSAEIDPSDKDLLERSARCLKADQHIKFTIEGNADERGTEEYNLALGDKRAAAVAKYL